MSAPFIIPFNFQPENTVVGASGTYTVPSGKYAIVEISLSCLCYPSITVAGGSLVSFAPDAAISESANITERFFLKAGDILSFSSSSSGSGSASTGGGTSIRVELRFGTAKAIALVNGVAVANAKSSALMFGLATTDSTNDTVTITATGDFSYGYVASEYNVIS